MNIAEAKTAMKMVSRVTRRKVKNHTVPDAMAAYNWAFRMRQEIWGHADAA